MSSSVGLPTEHAGRDIASEAFGLFAELEANRAGFGLDALAALFHDLRGGGARLAQDLRLELGCFGAQAVALLGRGLADAPQLGLVASQQLAGFFLQLTRGFACAFG